jgi:hypothetical protein
MRVLLSVLRLVDLLPRSLYAVLFCPDILQLWSPIVMCERRSLGGEELEMERRGGRERAREGERRERWKRWRGECKQLC